MPTPQSQAEKLRSIVVVSLLFGTTLYTGYSEGYLSLIRLPLWLAIVCSSALAVYLATSISTRHLLASILAVLVVEYWKETVGVRCGMWTYHGIDGRYLFGVWLWVTASLSVLALSRLAVRYSSKLQRVEAPRALSRVTVLVVAALIPITLGKYWRLATPEFWIFYLVAIAIDLVAVRRIRAPWVLLVVIVAWSGGGLSEYLGGIHSAVWTFAYDVRFPPRYLIIGGWPLEILAQFAIAAFLSQVPLSKLLDSRGEASHA
jgi:hypothetical protein